MNQLAEQAKAQVNKMIAGLDDFQSKIAQDQIARDAVADQLRLCMNKAMGGLNTAANGSGPQPGEDEDESRP